MSTFLAAAAICVSLTTTAELSIDSRFPGGSAQVDSLDQAARRIVIRPAPHKDAGWQCWWSFKLNGIHPGERIQLIVKGMNFARPIRASFSLDGRTWQHTAPGNSEKDQITYDLQFEQPGVWLAWGPPFQLSHAKELIARTSKRDTGAKEFTLATTKGGSEIPALRWDPPARDGNKRRGIWLQAGQHAWESGARWVGAGFVDWLISDEAEAKSLRATTRIVYIPIMDIDNVELGAGGKDQKPHDHNRDWSNEPVFSAVRAAQLLIQEMDEAEEFDLFIDLHNPAPNDLKPFFFVSPAMLLSKERAARQQEWIDTATLFLSQEKLSLAPKHKESGPGYHPLWREISKNWVTVNTKRPAVSVTLETSYNTPHSTQEGYQAYGRALGRSIHAFLERTKPRAN
ncbi:Zinc carboxypeptidase [Anatilimnocola aggregata]|uniref:Zinc carboxypeptidase n=1 Tax=Anatilimnocola aggregata TaxID=2528021 RepID=A0A517YCH6_9BACT|nr:M14 family zinc carboxypeptidase [Anatilimnocola aggregata]QDU27934.1 Zinc carboxypeptidase [Anatilimnocola aggregata]